MKVNNSSFFSLGEKMLGMKILTMLCLDIWRVIVTATPAIFIIRLQFINIVP